VFFLVCTDWQALVSSQSIFKIILSNIRDVGEKTLTQDAEKRKKAEQIAKNNMLIS
jgi:hypothetical protein